jgi:hypothetical protein
MFRKTSCQNGIVAGALSVGSPLHENGSARYRACDVDSAMSGHARDPQAGALIRRDFGGQRGNVIEWYHGKFGGSAERAVGLGSVAPDASAYPVARGTITDLIHLTSPVTVRNHAWVRHADAEGILTLLDIAGIDA